MRILSRARREIFPSADCVDDTVHQLLHVGVADVNRHEWRTKPANYSITSPSSLHLFFCERFVRTRNGLQARVLQQVSCTWASLTGCRINLCSKLRQGVCTWVSSSSSSCPRDQHQGKPLLGESGAMHHCLCTGWRHSTSQSPSHRSRRTPSHTVVCRNTAASLATIQSSP